MKYLKSIVAVLVLLAVATGTAWAERGHFHGQPGHFRGHHDHFHSRVFVGIGVGPFWDPWWYGYPPAVVYSSPPVYIEQPQSQAPSASHYWYYCAESGRYFPSVTECPGGWQQVAPTPQH